MKERWRGEKEKERKQVQVKERRPERAYTEKNIIEREMEREKEKVGRTREHSDQSQRIIS